MSGDGIGHPEALAEQRGEAGGGGAENEVTVLLSRWTGGDQGAFEQLLALLYGELRHLAASLMRGQPAGHTLQPTALIHEVYLKLAGRQELSFVNRSAFLGLAAKAMRRILVDHARARAAAKRGGEDHLRVTLADGFLAAPEKPSEVVALDAALEALAAIDPRKSRAVELKYFGGLTGEEIAAALGVGTATVTRDLRLAEAWLHREMTRTE